MLETGLVLAQQIGAAIYAGTNEPVWIAVGVAIGAALGWRKPKSQKED